jgi:hypothetical protein
MLTRFNSGGMRPVKKLAQAVADQDELFQKGFGHVRSFPFGDEIENAQNILFRATGEAIFQAGLPLTALLRDQHADVGKHVIRITLPAGPPHLRNCPQAYAIALSFPEAGHTPGRS